MKNRVRLLIVFAAAMLLLTGCGKKKKYEAAQALEEAGSYYEAYRAYRELSGYEDASERAREMESAARSAAVRAFREGRYEEAIEHSSHFPGNVQMDRIGAYSKTALDGTKIDALSVTADGMLAFEADDATGTATLAIALNAENETLAGTVTASVWPDGSEKKDDRYGYFEPSLFRTGSHWSAADLDMNEWGFDCESRKLTLVDMNALTAGTRQRLGTLSMVGLPVAYKAILKDGREGSSLTSFKGLRFESVAEAFAGGKLTMRIVDPAGTVLFEKEADIPAKES